RRSGIRCALWSRWIEEVNVSVDDRDRRVLRSSGRQPRGSRDRGHLREESASRYTILNRQSQSPIDNQKNPQSAFSNPQSADFNDYLAHASSGTLASVPALTVPVRWSTITAASDPIDQGPGTRCGNLCPLAASAAFTVSEMRDS